MHWIEFTISAIVIILAGIRLTTYADILSDRLKLGKLWIGIVLLGLITSLPEAITTLVAIIGLNANDLAVGNLLGSNNFNPILIVLLDMVYRQGSVTNSIKSTLSQKISAYAAILLTVIVIIEIILHRYFSIPQIGILTYGTLLIGVVYCVSMKTLKSVSKDLEDTVEHQVAKTHEDQSLKAVWINILACTIVVTISAIILANSADKIAVATGLGRTFVGTILLAFVTSLPEMVVTLSALRLGSLDLAVGNIFGSNMTNIFILFICQLFYSSGAILNNITPTHLITAASSIILTVILVRGINNSTKKSYFNVGTDSWLMSAVFISILFTLYYLR